MARVRKAADDRAPTKNPAEDITCIVLAQLPETRFEEKQMGIQKQEEPPSRESKQRTLSEFMS